ncbi:hypothetical protein Tco_0575469 [Tanacetum coccineum]
MDIFAFIHAPNPTKVKVVEWERIEDEPLLLKTTVGRTVPLLLVAPDRAESELEASVDRLFDEGGSGNQTEQGDSAGGRQGADIDPVSEAADTAVENVAPMLTEDHGTPSGDSVGGKSRSAVQRLLAGAVLNTEDRGGAIPTLPFVTSSVSAMPEHSSHHSGANVAEAEADSLVRSSIPAMTVATTVTLTVSPASIAKKKPVEPSSLFAGSSLTSGTDPAMGGFTDLTSSDFLVSAARQMSLSAKVRMRAEYNVKERRRLKSVIKKKDELLRNREGEIENLKARLLLREAEAAEAIYLHAEASNFGAMEKSLWDETNALRERNVILEKERNALDVKVHKLEVSSVGLQEKVTVYENCTEHLEKFQDDQMKVINDKFDKLYTDFVEMTLHLEEKFYLYILTTISGRRWLLTQGMEFAIIKYFHSPEYLSALGAAIGKAIEKGMQDGLSAGITHGREGRVLTDDASIEAMMNILRLEEPLADKLGLNELQPHVDQLMVPIHHSPDKVVIGATALSLALDVSSIRVWKIRENIANQRSALRDMFVPLAEPFSAATLTAAEGTFDTMAAAVDTAMALSTTFSASTIVPISIDDYEVVGTDDQAAANEKAEPFLNVDDAKLNVP